MASERNEQEAARQSGGVPPGGTPVAHCCLGVPCELTGIQELGWCPLGRPEHGGHGELLGDPKSSWNLAPPSTERSSDPRKVSVR